MSAPDSTSDRRTPLTPDQRNAFTAALLGWTMDAFDYFIVVLVYADIASDFGESKEKVALLTTVTLLMRPVGAFLFGIWADRVGRRLPLIVDVLLYSTVGFLCAFAPNLTVLMVLRLIYGIGMGGEWGLGAALAMESWPVRSRGFMSGVLQGSWGLGFALSAAAYGLLYTPLEAWHKGYGWRGMLILGVLPALVCVWIRMYVKEPEVWAENKQIQNTTQQQASLPLFAIFKRKYLLNTLTGCLWMAANFCVYYAIWAMLGT